MWPRPVIHAIPITMSKSENSPSDAHDLPVAPVTESEHASVTDPLQASTLPIDEATAALQEAERLLAEQKDKYVRLFAEFENFRKRSIKERIEAEGKGMATLVTALLESLDDLGRFARVNASEMSAHALVEGVSLVEKNVLKSLGGFGVTVVNPDGEKFDPALHEALSVVAAATADEDDTVAQVYQVGYTFNGQLLRPARVVVRQWNG